MGRPRLDNRALFAGVLALLAVVLTVAGLYGIMSYLTSERTHEIGVRIALGATAASIARLVAGEAVRLTVIGAAIGCVGAYTSAQLLRRLLFGVEPTDWASFTVALVCLLLVTVAATLIPVRRAARMSPLPALRSE